MADFVRSLVNDDCSLAVSGEVDIATVDGLLVAARGCLDLEVRRLEIDLADVTFIDSSGLGALVRIRNEAGSRGAEVVLTNLPASLRRLFEITGLVQVFDLPARG